MPCHHTTSSCQLACHVIMPCQQNALFDYHVAAWGSATWHFSQNFPYWGQTSKRNIFCIRSPFDTPFAPLESSWWDLRHGTIFVEIWWFWKLAFLDPPGSPLDDSLSHAHLRVCWVCRNDGECLPIFTLSYHWWNITLNPTCHVTWGPLLLKRLQVHITWCYTGDYCLDLQQRLYLKV